MPRDYLEWIVYISIVVLFVWAVLKSFGIIHSPAWLEMIPYLSLSFGIGAGYTKLKNTLDNIDKDLKEIKSEHRDVSQRLNKIETEHNFFTKNKRH